MDAVPGPSGGTAITMYPLLSTMRTHMVPTCFEVLALVADSMVQVASPAAAGGLNRCTAPDRLAIGAGDHLLGELGMALALITTFVERRPSSGPLRSAMVSNVRAAW